ncbi:MAG: 50S ribosomal protein L9 [Holosporaceae bacterium]|nr:MAG: 50S ribosomal protein L9 [Holosporaceae bacterium]
MKIVLLERVEKLGKMGDVINVKDGFGRNYLLPQKKALRATKDNIAYFEKQKATLQAQSKDLQTKAEGIAKKISGVELIMIRQSSEAGNLYGSVSSRDIVKGLEEKEIMINHTMVRIEKPVKMVGVHEIKLILHSEVTTFIKISIAPSEEEALAFLKNPELAFSKPRNFS